MKGIIQFRTSIAVASLAALLPISGLMAQVSRAPATEGPTGRVPLEKEEVWNAPAVRFINRDNRAATAAQRRQQVALGQQLAGDVIQKELGDRSRIRVNRVFEGKAAGMGADVFSLEAGAAYGHVNAIQRVLAGYLMSAFEYNEADAVELSRFILYYNARHRGDMEKVKKTYSPKVAAVVKPETVGIDRSYRNWSGRTQILIPLRKSILRPGDKDIEGKELKKATSDLPAGERKKLQEVLEKRKTEDSAKLTKEAAATQQKKEEVTQQKKEVQGELADTQRKLEELRKDPEANKAEIAKEEKKQEALQEKKEELAKEEKAVEQKEQAIAEQKKENEGGDQKTAEEGKKEEAAKKEEQIAALKEENKALKEEKKEQAEKTENVVGEKILFLRVVRYLKDGHYKNELWAIDSANDDTLYRSNFNNICSREFKVFGDKGILVAGYKGEFPGHEHNLVLLDQTNLNMKAESKEQVYWQSPVIVKEDKIYAIIQRGETFFVGRFNADLTLEIASDKPVSRHSTISLVPGKVYVTGKTEGDKTEILVFKQEDLKQTRAIVPKLP